MIHEALNHFAVHRGLLPMPVELDSLHPSRHRFVLPAHRDWATMYASALAWGDHQSPSEHLSPGPPPRFSCSMEDMNTVSRLSDFASAAPVAKVAPATGLKAPSSDTIKADPSARTRLDDLLPIQRLAMFVQQSLQSLASSPPEDAEGVFRFLADIQQALVAGL